MKNKYIQIITILATIFVVACGSDKKDSTARTGTRSGTTAYSCSGCSNSNRLYTAIGRTGNGVDLIMELFAVNYNDVDADISQFNNGSYGGTVDGVGKLYVATGISCGYGNNGAYAPAGSYSVRVLGFGQIDPVSEVVSGITAEAIAGKYEIRMELVNAVFYTASPQMRGCDGRDYGTEMIGQWVITSINGYSCGNSITFGGYGTSQTQLICP